MQRISKFVIAAMAAFGLAFGSGVVMAQKADTPKDTPAKTDAKATDTKKADTTKSTDAKATDAKKADSTKSTDAKKAAAPADAKKADAKASTGLIDINSASEKELASLKGIGDVRAKAIVKGRPYKGKNELADKKIIPQSVYDDIKDHIIAKQDTAAAKKDEKKK